MRDAFLFILTETHDKRSVIRRQERANPRPFPTLFPSWEVNIRESS